jgi:hypothetical protein
VRLLLPLIAILALSPDCYAADGLDTNRASPIDKNPACMDRNTNSSSGKCVEPSAGLPRHKRPPPAGALGASPSGAGQATAPSSNRKASSGAK